MAGAVVYLAVILKAEFRKAYRTLSGWRPEPWLIARLFRFGMPTGLQYSLEVAAFPLFAHTEDFVGSFSIMWPIEEDRR